MKTKLDLERIKKFVKEDKFIISNHARVRMFQKNVSTDNIKDIEDEPCPSVLILGFLENVPYHVVIAQCEDHMRIITVYYPKEDKWVNYRMRRHRNETG